MDKLFIQQHQLEQRILDSINEIGNQNVDSIIYKLLNQLEYYYPNPSHLPVYTETERTVDESLTDLPNLATLLASWEIEMSRELPLLAEQLKKAKETLKLAEKNKDHTEKTIRTLASAKRMVTKAEAAQYRLGFAHSIRYSMVYAKLAIKFNSEGKTDKALAYASQASFIYGEISANSTYEIKELVTKKTSEQNRKNSLNRSKNFQAVKDYAVILLKTKKPINGWPTKKKAVEEIRAELEKFVDTKKLPGITTSNVAKTLLNKWSTEDEIIKKAFEAALS